MILFHLITIPNGYQNEYGGAIFRFSLTAGISRHFHGNLRIFSIAYPFHFHLGFSLRPTPSRRSSGRRHLPRRVRNRMNALDSPTSSMTRPISSASRVLYRRRRNSSSWHFRTVICATSGRRESSFRGNYHVKNRNHSVRKISLNPPPKIEFHRYCKGLYANFMHPLVKKRFYNIMITMKEQRWWISDFSVLLHF